MILDGLDRHRRFAGALALLGMAFYAVLVPWHAVSQATGPPLSFEPPCHQASTVGNAKTP